MEALFKMSMIVSVVDKLSSPINKMNKAVSGFDKTMRAGRGIAEFGQRMTIAAAFVNESSNSVLNAAKRIGGSIAGMARTAVGAIQDIMRPTQALQDAMAPLSTVTTSTMGSVEKSMQASQQAAMEWSKAHTQAADEFIRTQYMMASAGLNDIQSIEGTKTALAVATATMGDATEAANLLATVYNNMGDKTKDVQQEMTRLGDTLTRTQQYFQFANLNVLTESLQYAMPAALQARMSLEQLSVVIGQLNNAGLQGSMAGTAFAATMRQMTKASADLGFKVSKTADGGVDFIKTIDNITKKYGDLSKASDKVKIKFQQAFGDEGLRALVLLQNKTDDMTKALEDVQKASGVTAEAQKKMEQTMSARLQILKNRFDAIKVSVGEQLIPVFEKLADPIEKVLGKVSELAEKYKIGEKISGIIEVMIPYLGAVADKLFDIVGRIADMAMQYPAAEKLGELFEKISPSLSNLSDSVVKFISDLAGMTENYPIVDQIANIIVTLSDNIQKALPFIGELIGKMLEFASAHPDLVSTAVSFLAIGMAALKVLSPIMAIISGFIMIGGYGVTAVGGVGKGISKLIGYLISSRGGIKTFTKGISGIKDAFTTMRIKAMYAGDGVKSFTGHISDGIRSIGSFTTKLAKGAWDALTSFGSKVGQVATDVGKFAAKVGTDAWNALSDFGSKIGQAVTDIGNFASKLAVDAYNAISDFASKVAETVVNIGDLASKLAIDAWNALVNFGSKIGEAVTSVATFAAKLAVDAWNAIASFALQLATTAWTAIMSFIGAMGGAIAAAWSFTAALLANPITWIVLAIIGLITVIVLLWKNWDQVSAFIKASWATIWAVAQAVWGSIAGFLQGVWDGIVNAAGKVWEGITGIFNQITGTVSNFIKGAWNWGQNLIQSFIDGIKSMFGKVGEVASSVMGKVKNFLGFHSPAKEGEGRYIILWGQNMVAGFVDGITKTKGMVGDAISDLVRSPGMSLAIKPEVERIDPNTLSIPLAVEGAQAARTTAVRLSYPAQGAKERPITVNGDIHVHVDKVLTDDELADLLRKLAVTIA